MYHGFETGGDFGFNFKKDKELGRGNKTDGYSAARTTATGQTKTIEWADNRSRHAGIVQDVGTGETIESQWDENLEELWIGFTQTKHLSLWQCVEKRKAYLKEKLEAISLNE